MGLTGIRNVCKVSLDIPAEKQPQLHNRWHPDVPFAGTIKNGETVKIECVSLLLLSTVSFQINLQQVDWTGGQIGKFHPISSFVFIDFFKYLGG